VTLVAAVLLERLADTGAPVITPVPSSGIVRPRVCQAGGGIRLTAARTADGIPA
jgi:hypothetical protein